MDQLAPKSLYDMARALEAHETDRWAVEAILDVELLTRHVIDPCTGTGIIPAVLEAKTENRAVIAYDIVDWRKLIPAQMKWRGKIQIQDWLVAPQQEIPNGTVIMNPPFSRACEFVDKARALGARKIICFQKLSWWESEERDEWWTANTPARIWVCKDRATCWRFDLLEEIERQNTAKKKRKPGEKLEKGLSGSTTPHAWFVWERGHPPAALLSRIRNPAAKKRRKSLQT